MPLTVRMGNIGIYGSSHMSDEIPHLGEFLDSLSPATLYLEILQGNTQSDVMPDMDFSIGYAARSKIPITPVGYSPQDVYKKLGPRHPVAVSIDIAFKLLGEACEGIARVQDGSHPLNGMEYQLHRELLESAQTPARFADAMINYLTNVSIFAFLHYGAIPPEARRKARDGLSNFLELTRKEYESIALSISSKERQVVPVREEDVMSAIEAANDYEMLPDAYRDIMKSYKQEWLTLTDATIWKNMRGGIQRDTKPIGIVIGYQHFPYITEQLRAKSGVL